MKIRKIIITAVITLAVILGAVTGWCIWNSRGKDPTPPDSKHLDWVWVTEYATEGALSDHGYYYASSSKLAYADFATGKSVILCGKAGCQHQSEDCDAHAGISFGRNMFFSNDRLYYVQYDFYGTHLYSRDATGASLKTIGSFGTKYIEQQKSMDIDRLIPVDNFLYYHATVEGEKDGVITGELEYIARMNLSTGKEEILIEEITEISGEHLWLYAARKDGVIYSHYQPTDLDRDDPEYANHLKLAPHSLMMWDEASGESATLFQKTIEEFSGVKLVSGGKVYYKSLTTTEPGSGGLYAYDLTTGEDALFDSNGSMWQLGGGYAFRKQDSGDSFDIFNLQTKEMLPNALIGLSTSGAGNLRCAGSKGFILKWFDKELRKENESDEYGYRTQYYDYVSYESLADGLQKEDMISLISGEVMSSEIGTPTTPSETTPPTTEPEGEEATPITFDTDPPIPDESTAKRIQYLPETVENPDDLPVLKWVCLIDHRGQNAITYREDAVHDLNRMLADRNMPFRVQIIVMTYEETLDSSRGYGTLDWFSSPEAQEILKDADLIYGSFTQEERKAYLMPITDYVTGDAQPSLANAVPHELNWLDGFADGEYYGIPSSVGEPYSTGWLTDPAYMQEHGLTPEDLTHDLWEMDTLFAKLYEDGGKKAFIELDNHFSFTADADLYSIYNYCLPRTYQTIGALFAIDHSAETPAVVNLLETEALQNIRNAILQYTIAGYTVSRGDDVYGWTKLDYQGIPGGAVFTNPIEYAYSDGKNLQTDSKDMILIPAGASVYNRSSGGESSLIGVAAVSQHKAEALSLLNLVAEDEQFRLQLCYGTEGQDYEIIDGEMSLIQDVETVQETEVFPNGGVSTYTYEKYFRYQMDFLSPLCKYGSLSEEMRSGYPTYAGKTKLETYREMMDNVSYVYYPIGFDFSGLEQELEELGYALAKYFKDAHLRNFFEIEDGEPVLTDEEYAQMLQAIKTAGSDKIIAELQRQLDAWLTENPGWQ